MIIDGKAAAEELLQSIKDRIEQNGYHPVLAVVVVGEDPASRVYVRNKARACEKTGIVCRIIRFPEFTPEPVLAAELMRLNQNPDIHGIILQLPLPLQINRSVADAISPEKDVDGLTPESRHRLQDGKNTFIPCTPKGIMRLLRKYDIPLDGANACIIGRSDLVGRPLAKLMEQNNATVTLCHSATRSLAEHTRSADIVVAAAGVPNLISAKMIKPGAVVIDVGINRLCGRLVGDCSDDIQAAAGYYTPVPGGVGPMTVAELLDNTLRAYLEAANAFKR